MLLIKRDDYDRKHRHVLGIYRGSGGGFFNYMYHIEAKILTFDHISCVPSWTLRV